MEEIQQKIKKIKFNNCERNVEHSGNQKNMICVDKNCIGNEDRYLSLMCAMCVEENIHQIQNHAQKPFQKVIQDLLKEIVKKKQECDKIQLKFNEIHDFINELKASVIDELLLNKANQIIDNLSSSKGDNIDENFMENLIQLTQDIEYNEETKEISLKNNNPNDSIDSDSDSSIAHELFKDFERLIEIFAQNNHLFDYNIIIPLQGYRLLSEVKDSPLGSTYKEKLFKDAFRLDSALMTDIKRASGSRRQSLEMFEADKKILLLMNENDRINFSLNAKQDEIDILKIKLLRAEEELKNKPSRNPEEVDSQIRILQYELDRVNKALEFKNKEIESLYQKNSFKIQENGETIIELQAQVDMLIKENERLNAVICAKDQEIGSIQSITNLEDKSAEGFKAEVMRLNKIVGEQNSKIEMVQKENQIIIEKKQEEVKNQKDQYNHLYQKYSQFGQQIDQLSKEVERLTVEIQQKTDEIDLWKSKLPKENTPREQNYLQYSINTTINSNPLIPHYSQYNPTSNNINPIKLFNNYGNGYQASQVSSQAYMNRDRLVSEGQSFSLKLDQVKSASHIKKISAIDKIDLYKKNDNIQQQPLSSRFRSPPTSIGKSNQLNITSTVFSIKDYDIQNKSLITPTVKNLSNNSSNNQSSNFQIGTSSATIERKTSAPSNNVSQDEKSSSLASSLNYYKIYKQNSQLNSAPQSIQSFIPYKERIDSKIQNLSKEIGKLNNFLDNRDKPDQKTVQQLHQNFIKQQNCRSGSEGLKNKNFK